MNQRPDDTEEPSPSVVILSVRVPAELREKYVAWANDCKVSMSEILRGILDWAIIHRPDWQPDPQRDWESCMDPDEMAQAIQPCKPDRPVHRALTMAFVSSFSTMYLKECDHDNLAGCALHDLSAYASDSSDWDSTMASMKRLYDHWRDSFFMGVLPDSSDGTKATMAMLNPLGQLHAHGLAAALSSVPMSAMNLMAMTLGNRKEMLPSDRAKNGAAVVATFRKGVCDNIRSRFPMAPAGFVDRSRQKGQSAA